jgi:thioredoxin reductase (NADPH)
VPKELKIDGLARFNASQVFYRLKALNRQMAQRVVVLGGEATAIESAITLATQDLQPGHSVTLIHRRDVLQSSAEALEQLAALRASGRIEFIAGQVSGIEVNDGRLEAVIISTPDNQTLAIPLDTLLVCQGISPKLGPIANWSLAMEHKQLSVNPATCATSEPGVYAVGDINTYPGKKKLILCGFHEATLAAFAAAHYLKPEQSEVLQYTTSSGLLQQRLGLAVETVRSVNG